jgi:Tol biopolymer transport system component
VVNLTNTPGVEGAQEHNPSWSSDGTKIAFDSKPGQYSADMDIYVMAPDGSGLTNLTNTPTLREADPAWSPDGTKIVYARLDPEVGTWGIWTMNADGTDQTNLNVPGTQPDWGVATVPKTKAECKHGGYKDFDFKSQAKCIAYVKRNA